MGWVANTDPTGWYGDERTWKNTVAVPEDMAAVGWGGPLVDFPAGLDGGVDFFRLDPGDVNVPGFDGSAFGNDAGVFRNRGTWDTYGSLGDLPAGNYTAVAYAYNVDDSPPSGSAPKWQPDTDFGVWLDITGIIIGATLEGARGARDGVGIYVAKIDETAPVYQRLIYTYSAADGLVELGPIDDPISNFAPTGLSRTHNEVGGGDLGGRSYVPVQNEFPHPQVVLTEQSDAAISELDITTLTHFVPVLSRPGLLYALSDDNGGSLDRFLAGSPPRFVDTVSGFPRTFPVGDDSGHFDIIYGLVDKDDATILYGMSPTGLYKASIQANTVTPIVTFTPNFHRTYGSDVNFGSFGSQIIGQRANGDIVTATMADVQPFGFVHTWGRDGSGLKTEVYLGGLRDDFYAPMALALLDDDTVFFSWSIYGNPARLIATDLTRYGKDRVQHFYTAPVVPNYQATTYESLPASERLFTNGTTGRWTTDGRIGNVPGARDPFLIDDSVPPHNGVGRTILSDVGDWEDNQYTFSYMDHPVLPGDELTFSVWLMLETKAGDNLLEENESEFETGISPDWVTTAPFAPADETLTLMTDGGHTGDAYMRLYTADGDSVQDPGAKLDKAIAVDGTTVYQSSIWVRPSRGMRVQFQTILVDDGGGIVDILVADSPNPQAPGVWTFLQSDARTITGGAVQTLRFVVGEEGAAGSNPGDTIDVDDLQFGQAPIYGGTFSEIDLLNYYGYVTSFFSEGGDDTPLAPDVWTQVVVTGTVPGTFPPGVDPGTPRDDGALEPGVPVFAFLRFDHPGPGKLWISDLSLKINGHRDVGIKHVGEIGWPVAAEADDLHYFVAENGWSAVLHPVGLLAGEISQDGLRFNFT